MEVIRLLALAAFGLSMVAAHSAAPEPVIAVGSRKQLFVDDYSVARMEAVRRVPHPIQKHPANPILRKAYSWEQGITDPHVAYDPSEKKFHMWYRALDTEGKEHCGYAWSRDGVTWHRPSLGLVEYAGNRANNYVLGGGYFATVAYDPLPGTRAFLGFRAGMQGQTTMQSLDGIHWTPHTSSTGDLRNTTYGVSANPNARYFYTGQCWGGTNAFGGRKRAVMRADSDDLVKWGGGRTILSADANDPPSLEFYMMWNASENLRSGSYHGVHLGFLCHYHTHLEGEAHPKNKAAMSGTIDVYLASSRDTVTWQRVDRTKPFVPLGSPGSFDSGMIFLTSLVEFEDKLYFYYGGWNVGHGLFPQGEEAIGMGTLRLDGFVSIEPEGKEGSLTTKRFALEGDSLEVNVDASKGKLLVEVMDAEGKPVSGLTRRECRPLVTDGLRQRVTWGKGHELSALRGKPVQLRFHLLGNAKLYAFQVLGEQKKTKGITGVTRGDADLRLPPSTPSAGGGIDLCWHPPGAPPGETWRYGLAAPFQVAPRKAGLFCNIRREYGPGNDFEVGNDVVLFDDLSKISADDAVPITRIEESINPNTDAPGERCVMMKQHNMGGFVPLGAKRADGSPHPHAGTGFGLNQALAWPFSDNDLVDSIEGGPAPQRRRAYQGAKRYWYWELHQFAYDGKTFRGVSTERIPASGLLAGWTFHDVGLQNALPDGDDLLSTMVAGKNTGLCRWRREGNRWHPVSYVPVTEEERRGEPSLVRDLDGSFLFCARGTAEANRNSITVWRSVDGGATWKKVIDVASAISQAPVSINQAADGTPYVIANLNEVLLFPMKAPFQPHRDSAGRLRAGGWLREKMYLWPLNAGRTGLETPLLVRDCRADFGPPPSGTTWTIDHPYAATVQLADGAWRHVLGVRIADFGEILYQLGPAPRTGACIEEIYSAGEPIPAWRF